MTPRPGNNKPCFRYIGSRYEKFYSEEPSADTIDTLQQGGVPPPTSNTIYSPPACSDLQLLNELSSTRSTSLRAMTPLNSNTNIEQSVQPPMTSQADRIIEIETYTIYSVNKVLLQQILQTVGQITKKALNKNPQQVRKLEPLVLELYRQLTHFLFNLEAEENRKTGQISIFPDVQLLVTKV